MSAMSDHLEGQLRAHIFRTASFTKPTVLAIALCTSATVDGDTGNLTGKEVANSNGYARQTLNPLDANWTAASSTDGLTDNATAIVFPTAVGGAWGTVTHFAILDNATWGSGNLLLHGALNAPVVINNGNAFSFPIGALNVTFD